MTPKIAPAHYLERVSRLQHRAEDPRQSPALSLELRKYSGQLRKSKAARVRRTVYWRGDSCMERKLRDQLRAPFECSAEYGLAFVCKETAHGWWKKTLERSKRNRHQIFRAVGIFTFPTAGSEKSLVHGASDPRKAIHPLCKGGN